MSVPSSFVDRLKDAFSFLLTPYNNYVKSNTISDALNKLAETLKEEYPSLAQRVHLNKDLESLFIVLGDYVHSQPQLKQLNDAPGADWSWKQILEWECHHVEQMANRLFAKEEIDEFIEKLGKNPVNTEEIEKQAPRILQLIARFPEFKIPLQSMERFTSPSMLLLRKVHAEPTIILKIGGEDTLVETAPFALHSEMIKKELQTPMQRNPIQLDEFSQEDIEMADQFFKNPQHTKIPPEKTLRLLYLADFLQAPSLQKHCRDELERFVNSLDGNKAEGEEIEQLLILLEDPVVLQKDLQRTHWPDLEDRLIRLLSSHLRNLFKAGSLEELQRLIDRVGAKVPLDLNGLELSEAEMLSLGQLKNLQHLDLSRTNINDLAVQRLPSSLKTLTLWECSKITDSSFLSSLTNLEKLYLTGTSIQNLSALSPSLKILHLSCKGITDFSPLERLVSLKALYLSDVKTLDLNHLPLSLRELTFYTYESLTHSESLTRLTSLEKIRFEGFTNIADGFLTSLPPSIQRIYLSGNLSDPGKKYLKDQGFKYDGNAGVFYRGVVEGWSNHAF